MKIKANNIRLTYTEQGKAEIILSTDQSRIDISPLKEVVAKGKALAVEVKQYRQKRSLDANAYLWVLLQKIAEAVNSSKDEVYLQMLERYGVFTHIVVKPRMVDKVRQEWRAVRELGEVTVNGQTGIQLQCFFGSSTYDTKEMATLIDGVVSECKELGIETMTPEELQLLKNEWGK
ncbi:MAG: recombination protein NinB [Eubacteriales bacterium]|nr:recombination protein NinB [Eubacteriales bacterium]